MLCFVITIHSVYEASYHKNNLLVLSLCQCHIWVGKQKLQLISGTISRQNCKINENTGESPKCTPFFIFSKDIQLTRLESLLSRFWAPSLIFYTPGLYGYVVPKPWPQRTTNNPATDTLIFQGVATVANCACFNWRRYYPACPYMAVSALLYVAVHY